MKKRKEVEFLSAVGRPGRIFKRRGQHPFRVSEARDDGRLDGFAVAKGERQTGASGVGQDVGFLAALMEGAEGIERPERPGLVVVVGEIDLDAEILDLAGAERKLFQGSGPVFSDSGNSYRTERMIVR